MPDAPSLERVSVHRVAARLRHQSDSYAEIYEHSTRAPDDFWLQQADCVDWITPPTLSSPSHAQEPGTDHGSWFADGTMNISVNALDRHVAAGRGHHPALITDSAMIGEKSVLTYAELLDRVRKFAGALHELGVGAGDRVLIYLPMISEAVVAMLACARIGAIHSVVFGGFAANELAVRINDATPSVIVTATGGLEPSRQVEYLPIVHQAIGLSTGSVRYVVVKDRPQIDGDIAEYTSGAASGGSPDVSWLDWDELESSALPADAVEMRAQDPLYILYTSGTTGSPKGVVRDTGGYAVALQWAMTNIYAVGPDSTIFTASDVGWVVGHSFIVYGPLLAGAATVLYEGKPIGTPDAGTFWRIIQDYAVDVLYTAPTALRAIRREDPTLDELEKYDTSSLQAIYLAGERLDTETWHWANDGIRVPIVDHWWQTETGWPICANPRGVQQLESKAGSTGVPMPGFIPRILDREGNDVTKPGTEGNIAIQLPLPPGALIGLWGSTERFENSYLTEFPGYYATGDAGYFDDDGYLFVMGRTDDVINVAGHRLSTGSFEEVISQHPDVAECAVLGLHDELKGQRAAAFITMKHGRNRDEGALAIELVALVREVIGPVAAFRDVMVVERLPKTRSGKILRKTIRQIFDGEEVRIPPTIEDVTVLDAIYTAAGRIRSQ
ncbi:AMP-binding protein [Salinibacterium sp. SWN1162]|uniref:AMP-binding protein n=1 Tax=Salinibacterium sp. SWN1162 TaxID=2792053 RepID=UPI0018CF5A31|nr:AMP-binding protein [Salinibacterium sp. SWN1162]MBH0008713.1 AMP-binding protein [Salinibacterium sp. SWN1162]